MENVRSYMEWVSIENVIPNPLNPRKDDSVRTQEMQDIIKKRGWEEPLTVYKKGKNYVVLAGHRRLFAARAAKLKEIPVFVTEAPNNRTQELERIAGLQSGRVNWTPLEWATFVYDQWNAKGKPQVLHFSKQMNMPHSTVQEYISVLEYYPLHEIEAKLINKAYTFRGLSGLAVWLRKLKENRPQFVKDIGENYIKELLMAKLERGYLEPQSLKHVQVIKHITDEDLRSFLFDKTMSLKKVNEKYHIDEEDQTLQGQLVTLGRYFQKMKRLKAPVGVEEKRMLAEKYREMAKMLTSRSREFERAAKKEEEKQQPA